MYKTIGGVSFNASSREGQYSRKASIMLSDHLISGVRPWNLCWEYWRLRKGPVQQRPTLLTSGLPSPEYTTRTLTKSHSTKCTDSLSAPATLYPIFAEWRSGYPAAQFACFTPSLTTSLTISFAWSPLLPLNPRSFV